MMEQNPLELTSAFRLGRLIEELASVSRKNYALDMLRKEGHPVQDERFLSRSPDETELTGDSITSLVDNLTPRFPKRLVRFLRKLEQAQHSGLGGGDYDQISLLHAGIVGLIMESTKQATTWHCLEAGRLSQRSYLLMNTIVDGLGDHHLPNETLLKYLAIRADCPYGSFEEGTHIWILHQVFQHLLKVSQNPKSAESTFTRLGLHIESLPVPESLKKDHEKMRMTHNRISNDLAFVDIHEMIGDDPQDHIDDIIAFFRRQQSEISHLVSLIQNYLIVFEAYIEELSEDEFFEFQL